MQSMFYRSENSLKHSQQRNNQYMLNLELPKVKEVKSKSNFGKKPFKKIA